MAILKFELPHLHPYNICRNFFIGILLLALAGSISPLQIHSNSLAVKENLNSEDSRPICRASAFGATGTGKGYDTNAIQSSIDACATMGGGVVYISPGTYLTATLFLRTNITLWIAKGATILGSQHQRDFPNRSSRWYTILAEDAENVVITGGGAVNGQGLKFVTEFKEEKNIMVSWNITGDCVGDECRPRLVGFINCKNVTVWNVSFQQPAYWW